MIAAEFFIVEKKLVNSGPAIKQAAIHVNFTIS